MSLDHRIVPMSGRDPGERHRSVSPLELLFDLTFAVAFSVASNEAAALLEVGHVATALAGFVFAVFAVSWAWANYTWLASAYDNDDIFFRVATLVEMVGVIVVALGVPQLFRSLDEGEHVDNRVMVVGYVIMRVAAVALWLRAAKYDPARRRACLTYATTIAIVQGGWVLFIVLSAPLPTALGAAVLLAGTEVIGPIFAERKDGGTPWHPFHLAERYSLLLIVSLGEVVLGTVLAISALVNRFGWSFDAVEVAVSGPGLAFGLWWLYFTLPSGRVLARHRQRAFGWSYGHIALFAAVVGTGCGLHVSATYVSGENHLGAAGTVLLVVAPVLAFELVLVTIYSTLLRTVDPFHFWVFSGAAAILVLAVVTVALGATAGTALVITACSPAAIVVAYEVVGHRHEDQALQRAGL
jgi:low temperature requirement protein LtrA